ncbi:MAG: hypothetical protein P1V35_08170 [Planctomycetota bacterium]|nr:hypothetical protein [Planctomycetota bacterium]
MAPEATEREAQCVEEVFQRVCGDLSMIADREMEVTSVETEVMDHRPAGKGNIHISFRLGFTQGEDVLHGCMLLPLAEAITLACSLMMIPENVIAQTRKQDTLDATTKDAMLEVGNFICGATDAAFRALGADIKVIFEGCQGVRPDVRPAMIYEEGGELIVGQADVSQGGFGNAMHVLMMPKLKATETPDEDS